MKFSEQFLEMEKYISRLQEKICLSLEEKDEVKFYEDNWFRDEGGGGRTRVIQNGKVFEKAGVNISSIDGMLPEEIALKFRTERTRFGACGISIVIHPSSPKVPTIHMNLRYFEMEKGKSWFGGGIDLTPYFPYTDDFSFFHSLLRDSCNKVIPGSYNEFKNNCDDYFTIIHRNEMRGIGGIFFDYKDGKDKKYFSLVESVGDSFLKLYLPLIEKRRAEQYSQEDKYFQLIRRGRYVEFNLVYDRGTLFGLKTGGKIESILMSLPPEVKFVYNYSPRPGTPHFEMTKYYKPMNWLRE